MPAMTTTFRARFEAVCAALRAHPELEVYGAELPAPASARELAAAEEFLGAPLPADVREFYAAHNGAYLEWGRRGRSYERTGFGGYPDYGSAPGMINILPLADVMSRHWQDEYHVNEVSDAHLQRIFGAVPESTPVTAVCVDNFDKYYHGDLILGPAPVMIVSTDHGADMEASDWVTFATYLDMTLALYGANRYTMGIGIGWSREPALRERFDERPSLDAIVARIAADEADD